MNRLCRWSLLSVSAVVCSVAWGGQAVVRVRPDRATCTYAPGETAKLAVTVTGTNGSVLTSGRLTVSVDNFGSRSLQPTRTVDLAKENPFAVTVVRDTPGFVRVTVTSPDAGLSVRGNAGQGGGYVYGVAYAPDRILPGTPEPADFDAFWAQAVRKLDETVPEDALLEPMAEQPDARVIRYRVSFATANGRRVYGWLSEPKDLSKGPFPVRISVPGAGIGATGIGGDAQTVCLTMNVHSYQQPEGKDADSARKHAYAEQDERYAKPNGVARYCQAGIHRSREDYFYYASILGINRAVNWLARRPECDRTRFTYSGTSQGGGFGLILTGLNRHITRSVIFVPAITDLLSSNVEDRQAGWPRILEAQAATNRAAAAQNAPYFCGVNFARRITCPIRFVVGFSDVVCAPHAVYAAYNVCPSRDKRIFDGIGMGHGVFRDFYDYLGAWERDFAEAPSAANGRYRFLAFNIWGDYFGNPVHERDLGEAAVIRRWGPDFVGLQEVTGNFWKSRLFTELADEYAAVGRGLGCDRQHPDAFDPVLYRRDRFDLVDSGAKWFCPELDGSKGLVWAVVRDKSTGAKFALFASHFWWRYDGQGDDWIRLNNAQLLHETMFAVAAKHDAAIVGGGDLNSSMEHAAMKYLVSHGLADAQATAAVSPRQFPTDHGDPWRDAGGAYFGVPAVRGLAPKIWSLDHVFYDPKRLAVDRFDIDLSPEACALSDHHPIIADFRIVRDAPADLVRATGRGSIVCVSDQGRCQ